VNNRIFFIIFHLFRKVAYATITPSHRGL